LVLLSTDQIKKQQASCSPRWHLRYLQCTQKEDLITLSSSPSKQLISFLSTHTTTISHTIVTNPQKPTMVIIQAIRRIDTTNPAKHLNNQTSHPPTRSFIPSLVQGAQLLPYTGWTNLSKPPPHGWWADRQLCTCPPCYFYTLTSAINNGTFPIAVTVPLAQLINVGLLRLNFRHAEHNNTFTAEEKDYALSLYRDICYGVNSGQLPLQLLEIMLVASRKAVLKPLDVGSRSITIRSSRCVSSVLLPDARKSRGMVRAMWMMKNKRGRRPSG
jgi:hypothetical protein